MNFQPLIEKIASNGDYFGGACVTVIVILLIVSVTTYSLVKLIKYGV